jgi:hypothetical protein
MIPAMEFEYFPIRLSEILLPILIPTEMDSSEKTPIDKVVSKGGAPVNPAPKPIAKQFIASANPSKIDSLKEMI